MNQTDECPSLDKIHEAEKRHGLHDRENLAMRVRWINALRSIVDRRMPRNKAGSPMTSDVDLMTATAEERLEALRKVADVKPSKQPLVRLHKPWDNA